VIVSRLFERLYARLQVAHDKDRRLFNRTPIFLSIRHGSLLTVYKRADDRLLRITLDWQQPPGAAIGRAWTASVFWRAVGARVALAKR
jgi:hypothetical protein